MRLLCAKTAELIGAMFGVETLKDLRHTGLDGDLSLPHYKRGREWEKKLAQEHCSHSMWPSPNYFGLLFLFDPCLAKLS